MSGVTRVSRATLVGVGVLSATIAFAELRESIELSSVTLVADRITNHQDVDVWTIQSVMLKLDYDASLVSCRSDILADVLALHLNYIDRLDENEDYDEWWKGVERTSAFVNKAIQCSPADGNLWLRLAMLRQAAVAIPAEIVDIMRRSVELSPAQMNVLLARLEVWRKMGDDELGLASTIVEADLSNILAFGNERDVAYAKTRLSTKLKRMGQNIVRGGGDRLVKNLSNNRINITPDHPPFP